MLSQWESKWEYLDMSHELRKSKFSFGLSTKIIMVTLVILISVVTVNYVVFLSGYRTDMLASYQRECEC